MRLEDQVRALTEAGLPLAPGRTVDDLLISFDRPAYETEPFALLLFVYGIDVEAEPWGRPFCERAWNFDTECVHGPGAYVGIARRLVRLTGRPDAVTGLADHVDLTTRTAWLEYTVDGRRRHWTVEVVDDWADMMVVSYLMDDLERDGKRFHAVQNGQAMVLFHVDAATAARVNALVGRPALCPVLAGGD